MNQRLYKEDYEKTKAKVTMPPDMLDIVESRKTQKAVSEIDYRKYLHQWVCLPDMKAFVHSRKVNEQFSDVSDLIQILVCACEYFQTFFVRIGALYFQNKGDFGCE